MKAVLMISLALGLAFPVHAQDSVRWTASTGDQALVAAATAATIQQTAQGTAQLASIDQITIYCSVACNATLATNGTAASTTAGTINVQQPDPLNTPIPLTFWTSSNVGAGTAQSPIYHVPAGGTLVLCLSTGCGNAKQVYLPPTGTTSNYTVSIASITGTVNICYFGRTFRS